MSVGILGTKLGMTQVFDSNGNAVPITVVQVPSKLVMEIQGQRYFQSQSLDISKSLNVHL
jgi:large subunit ribosomal protein L3